MRTISLRLALTLAMSASLAGCASMPMGSVLTSRTPETQPKPASQTKQGAKKGAGIGCAVGAAIGLAQGGLGNAAKGCVAGAAAGAVVGGARAYRRQLDDARAIAEEANALGIPAAVSTKPVQARGALGQAEEVEALDALTIDLDASLVDARDPGVQKLLEKAAHLALASELPTTLTVKGQAREWMVDELRRHLDESAAVQVQEAWAAKPALVLSPVPVVSS